MHMPSLPLQQPGLICSLSQQLMTTLPLPALPPLAGSQTVWAGGALRKMHIVVAAEMGCDSRGRVKLAIQVGVLCSRVALR